MQPLYMLQAVDVRRADVDGTSRATTIDKLTIPKLSFMTASHTAGGGVMEVQYTQPRIEAPEPAFSVRGLDLDIFGNLGEKHLWSFAAAYRDKTNGKDIAFRATIEGVVQSWEPDESDPAEFQGCNHMIREVTHLDIFFDGKEIWYIDTEEVEIRHNGQSLRAGINGALGV